MSVPTGAGVGPVVWLWTARQAAGALGVSEATLSRWRRGRVGPPFVAVGRLARYDPETVRRWVAEREAASRGG
jgi:transcriptional regulator with XRE-family HTH domain